MSYSELDWGKLPTVGVIGLGLIGGSIAQDWALLGGKVVAWSRSADTRRAAAAHHGISVVDSAAEVVAETGSDGVVFLATPMAVVCQSLDSIAETLQDGPASPTVSDVASVKQTIVEYAANRLSDPSLFVPGHPLAGTEHAGWGNALTGLFADASWALAVDEPVDLERWSIVAQVALALGARVVPVAAKDHDAAVAVTSHLPHLLAALLDEQLQSAPSVARTLVGPSFKSATRVIRGSGRSLGAELATANAQQLAPVSNTFAQRLADLAAGLANNGANAAGIRALFDGNGLGESEASQLSVGTIALERHELLQLGRAGGSVVGIDADGTVRCSIPVSS